MDWPGQRSVELFRRLPLFEGLPPEALARLVAQVRVIPLVKGKVLFRKGDPGDSLYVVAEGLIRIGVIAPDGRQVSYGLIHPGQLFGEIALFDRGPRTADASAMADSVLLALSRAEIHRFLTDHPSYALRMIGVLCQPACATPTS